MRILTAVLAHARRIIRDAARHPRRVLAEVGGEQQYLVVALKGRRAPSSTACAARARRATAPESTGQEPISASNQEIGSPLPATRRG